MELEQFRLDVADRIAVVTFDRPPVNAQNGRSREELLWIFDGISERDDVNVAILTGSGDMFSAGADMKDRSTSVLGTGDYARRSRLAREGFFSLLDCEKPVIAALNGPAIGAGYAMAACCDILLASENAYIQMPEIDVGLAGGANFLMQHFPRSLARQMYFTGCKVPASELYRLGIINACVPRDRLMDEAMELATVIARKSRTLLQRSKNSFNAAENMTMRDGYRYEQTVTLALSQTEDAREAQTAFLEKREAQFRT